MGFRERPEYQDWRDAVFRLFGQKCIRCGYAGNIHAHHVMPVNEYPELVFEPTNGVPLCGNCHVEVKGDELAHVDDLKRLQRAILEGENAGVAGDDASESILRERAYAEPSNSEVVWQWLKHTKDSPAVVDFYNSRHDAISKTALLCSRFGHHLVELGRWEEAFETVDEMTRCLEREGIQEATVGEFACITAYVLRTLGRLYAAVAFLRYIAESFPMDAIVHHELSMALFATIPRFSQDATQRETSSGRFIIEGVRAASLDPMEESARHALEAARLEPVQYNHISWVSFVLLSKGDYASALRYGNQALALASIDEDKIEALHIIAQVYMRNTLYGDARSYLQEALDIDDYNVEVIADIAQCYCMEHNEREAVRMAKRGLLLDPRNKACQEVLHTVSVD